MSCKPQNVAICACFDNEEIGSLTKQGANSSLLQTVLEKSRADSAKPKTILCPHAKTALYFPLTTHTPFTPPSPKNGYQRARVHGQGHSDKTSCQLLHRRRVFRNAKTILDKAGVERQDYYNNSDQRCGSTIGLMASANLGMRACDIGLAQLAMHSGIETVAYADIAKMQECAKAFLETRFTISNNSILIG